MIPTARVDRGNLAVRAAVFTTPASPEYESECLGAKKDRTGGAATASQRSLKSQVTPPWAPRARDAGCTTPDNAHSNNFELEEAGAGSAPPILL